MGLTKAARMLLERTEQQAPAGKLRHTRTRPILVHNTKEVFNIPPVHQPKVWILEVHEGTDSRTTRDQKGQVLSADTAYVKTGGASRSNKASRIISLQQG